MTQPMNTNKDNDALGAFAGIIMLIVILSIVFGLTTPNVSSNDVADTEDEAEIVVADETEVDVTEAIVVAEEPTAEPTQAVVVTATDVPSTDEPTVEPTQTVVVAATDVPVTDEPTEDVAADAEVASGDYDPEIVAHGEQLFIVCTACHGPDGRGLPGLGKDLVAGEFATTATDEELHALILNGRPIWDAANTTMVDMPPKGGNPALTDEDIDAIIAYIRSLQTP